MPGVGSLQPNPHLALPLCPDVKYVCRHVAHKFVSSRDCERALTVEATPSGGNLSAIPYAETPRTDPTRGLTILFSIHCIKTKYKG